MKPILKWAGGKRQLLPALRPYYPTSFARYVEPFVGSGSVFLDLHNSGLLEQREARLSDINADVIGCYRNVRDSPEDVINALLTLEDGHRAGGGTHFYEVRDERFNPRRRDVHAHERPAERYTPELAAMLIYLNRTGYNGLFRVNARGEFNVPLGRQSSVRICNADNLRRVSAALRQPGVTLEVQLFQDALAQAAAGDFVYLDPPLRSRQPHLVFHLLYLVPLRPGPAVAAAARRDRPGGPWRPRAPQQFGLARHQRALRA